MDSSTAPDHVSVEEAMDDLHVPNEPFSRSGLWDIVLKHQGADRCGFQYISNFILADNLGQETGLFKIIGRF
jgi:hypothetical protein